MSLTSVLLPLPLTPVMATKHPSGKSTSMCFRLCSCASRTVIQASPGVRRISGMGIERLPERYWPVIDRGSASSFFSVPATTISPPCSPAPGPMSTM